MMNDWDKPTIITAGLLVTIVLLAGLAFEIIKVMAILKYLNS